MSHTIFPIESIEPLDFIAVWEVDFPEQSRVDRHQHTYGTLNIAKQGVLEIEVENKQFLAPPNYCLWVPAGHLHSCYNKEYVLYNAIHIAPQFCKKLPATPSVFRLSKVVKALLDDFTQRGIIFPKHKADKDQAKVMLNHIYRIGKNTLFLPMAKNPSLKEVLRQLEQEPDNNDSLSVWAKRVYSTERTLARRCEKELGMPFGMWRQRLRLLKGIEMLYRKKSVETIALSLGYSTASNFITMFKRHMGTTPAQYIKQK